MHSKVIQVKKWSENEPPIESVLVQKMRDEGMQPTRWVNGAGTVYHAGSNLYHKIIYVVSGSIIFGFQIDGEPVQLIAGDSLSLPAGVEHNAIVGDEGITYLEGRLENS